MRVTELSDKLDDDSQPIEVDIFKGPTKCDKLKEKYSVPLLTEDNYKLYLDKWQ